jgi:hypothetical protein
MDWIAVRMGYRAVLVDGEALADVEEPLKLYDLLAHLQDAMGSLWPCLPVLPGG